MSKFNSIKLLKKAAKLRRRAFRAFCEAQVALDRADREFRGAVELLTAETRDVTAPSSPSSTPSPSTPSPGVFDFGSDPKEPRWNIKGD